jgi:hypothetical protein
MTRATDIPHAVSLFKEARVVNARKAKPFTDLTRPGDSVGRQLGENEGRRRLPGRHVADACRGGPPSGARELAPKGNGQQGAPTTASSVGRAVARA